MKKVIAAGFLTLTILAGTRDQEPQQQVCMEDMPCWDCDTMGNMVCGPEQED
jgi:hypothetical protein